VTLVSVIVPTLGEADCLASALASAGHDARVEVIVVNGGQRTEAMAALESSEPAVRWKVSPPGRGLQMNLGARHAHGEWLLFLHADTLLPAGWFDEIERLGRRPRVVGGSFRFRLDSPKLRARLLERGVAMRVRLFDLPYGDQALFVRRETFERLGGFRELPLMEDVELVRRLRRIGRLHHSALPAVTSANRWEADGWVRRSLENVFLLLSYLAGVSPDRLAARYRKGDRSGESDRRVAAPRHG
jgi:rSAM/selenodomain-associated transferase 2